MTEDGIGAPLRRREDLRFLTGRGRYVHDIVRPQQLHAVFLRSPHAHAEIAAIEKAEALASPASRRSSPPRTLSPTSSTACRAPGASREMTANR
jgi:CO/xanthine dehydrogenase Mo-binding subunit